MPVTPNSLLYGDNADWLPEIATASIDVVYLDPPFNSGRDYNIFLGNQQDAAQVHAFDDTWHWSPATDEQYRAAIQGGAPADVADALRAFRVMIGESDLMCYLVNMAPRLVELRRVLKDTGSLFLHCDPTASHYLKLLLDKVFGPTNFNNEIIWCYSGGGVPRTAFARKHDTILSYVPRKKGNYFVAQYVPYSESTRAVTGKSGRRVNKTDIDLERGGHMPDWWTDINALQTWSAERLGYPTQKPEALLRRIIDAACPKGGVILDPFCGCGTTVSAAEAAGRAWIGIDISYLSIHLIQERLKGTYGSTVSYRTQGIPRDLPGAQALFEHSPFDFERWAVSQVEGTPNTRQVGDKGVDGNVRFPLGRDETQVGRALVSVKGGRSVGPTAVRDLQGTVESQGAQMGILITLSEPTRGVREACARGGTYIWPVNGRHYPKVQVITAAQLLADNTPEMPAPYPPYKAAARASRHAQDKLDLD